MTRGSSSFGSFGRILVPVDFSLRSANALEFAVAFGSLQRAEVDVLHVWHSDLSTGVTVAKERAKSTLREFVASLELQGNVALRRRLDHGDPYLTIQNLIQLTACDLVVVAGPDGQRADDDSVARALFSSAPCPVLFVPAHSKARRRSERDRALNLERLLVPLALAGVELEALDCAEALPGAERATIEVLSTPDASAESRARLHARAPESRREQREEPQASVSAALQRARTSAFDLLIFCAKRGPIGARQADTRAQALAWSQPHPSLCLPG